MNRLHWTVPVIAVAGTQLSAQPCQPQWSDAFSNGLFAGGDVRALAQGTIGGSYQVFAAGHFSVPARRIARWDGYSWKPFGAGLDGIATTYSVGGYALAIFDDGSGPALYVGGVFNSVDGISASHIARWNGNSWAPLGEGVNNVVRALAVFDDGTGPALYAAGYFTTAGGIPAAGIARWRGGSPGWSSIGNLDLSGGAGAYALTVFDDGSGPALYVGGSFGGAASVPSPRVVRYSASGWSAVGGGIGQPYAADPILALTATPAGAAHPQLYAGGTHRATGAAPTVYRWDGTSWGALRHIPGQFIAALALVDSGGPEDPDLVVGGTFTLSQLWHLQGGTWTVTGPTFPVRSLLLLDDPPTAPRTLAVGGGPSGGIARWRAGEPLPWMPPRGLVGGGEVRALKWHDDGSGPALYAAGTFNRIGGVSDQRLARWDGQQWSQVGSQTLAGLEINALEVFEAPTGPGGNHLYAGGYVSIGQFNAGLARWDGQTWQNMVLTNTPVRMLRTLTFQGQRRLYVGGSFQYAGAVLAPGIFTWDGSTAAPLGGGVHANDGWNVSAATIFDDGTGPGLYIAGRFTHAGGVPANSIARWDGASYQALGSGLQGAGGTGQVHALAVYGRTAPPRLFAAGSFTQAGGQPVQYIAAWNGATWAPLPTPTGFVSVRSLTNFDDGPVPRLLVGSTWYVWDGEDFTPLTSGCMAGVAAAERLTAPGGATHLYLGGSFGCFGPTNSSGIVLRIGCPTCYANCDNSTIPPILNVEDFSCFISEFAAAQNLPPQQQLTHYANCDQSNTPPVLNVEDFTCFINRFAAGCP
jgi:trimeric autotransporter adhesin